MTRPSDRIIFVVALFVLVLLIMVRITPRPPVPDGFARYAYGVSEFGVYGPADGSEHAPAPSMGRAPLYPWFLTLFVALDSQYREYLSCHYQHSGNCGDLPVSPRVGDLILGLLSIIPLYFTARRLGASERTTYVSLFVLMGIWLPWTYMHGVSESIALPLHALLTYMTVRFLFDSSQRQFKLVIGIGLVLGLLALGRFAYQFYIPILMIVVFFAYRSDKRHAITRRLIAVVLLLVGFAGVTGPWYFRNYQHFGVVSLGSSGSTGVIVARVHYNRMNPAEYAASFLYWFPFVGEKIAVRILPEAAWARLNTDNPDGFRQRSQMYRRELGQQGYSRTDIRRIAQAEVVKHWPKHLFVSIPFVVRGLRYAILFVPLTLVWLWHTILHRKWRSLVALSGGWFIIVFHAGLTHFNVRYGWPIAFDFACVSAVGATVVLDYWKQRRAIADR